ncbi:MAG TPA: hypothetical protein VLI55_05530 [Bryobacteraceae bacterium]|nr:hypothetical protein [Bryobacteraceae bacterium]
MKQLLATLMLINAVLLILGAVQHAGIALGPFRQPPILPATIVESICALALIWGAAAVLSGSPKAWLSALIGNLVAIAGVTLGIVALALRAGPRTASNDLSHRIMLVLAAASLVILFLPGGRVALRGHKP